MMKRILLARRVMISLLLLVRQAMTQRPPPSPLLIERAHDRRPSPVAAGEQGLGRHGSSPLASPGKGKVQEREGYLHAIQSDPTTPDVAKTALAVQRSTLSQCDCKVDEADRLLLRASARPGYAGDGDRDVGMGLNQRAFGHGSRNGLAHGTMGGQHICRYTEVFLFGSVGVGDIATLEDIGGAGDLSEQGGDEAPSAALGGDEPLLRRAEAVEQASRLVEQRR